MSDAAAMCCGVGRYCVVDAVTSTQVQPNLSKKKYICIYKLKKKVMVGLQNPGGETKTHLHTEPHKDSILLSI